MFFLESTMYCKEKYLVGDSEPTNIFMKLQYAKI